MSHCLLSRWAARVAAPAGTDSESGHLTTAPVERRSGDGYQRPTASIPREAYRDRELEEPLARAGSPLGARLDPGGNRPSG